MNLLSKSDSIGRRDFIGPQWAPRAVLALAVVVFGVILGVLATAVNPLYVIAALVGIFALVAVLINVEIGLFAFVVVAWLLPFGVIPVSLGGVRLTFIDVILVATLLVWLMRVFAQSEQRPNFNRMALFVAVFLALAIVSYVAGSAYGVTGEQFRLYLKLLNSIAFFFTIVACVRTRRQLDRMIGAIIIAGTAASILGLILYFLPAGSSTQILASLRPLNYPTTEILRYIADTKTLRAIATSVDPNVLGAVLMVPALLAINQLLSPSPLFKRKWLVAATAAIVICQLLTFSRSSWVGLVAGIVVICTLRYRKLWILAGLLIAAAAIAFMPSDIAFISHLQTGLAVEDRATQMRLGEYKDAFTLISRFPVFGVGFGSAPSIDLYVGVSSFYLLMAEQMGLVGVGWFLVCCVYAGTKATTRILRAGVAKAAGALGTHSTSTTHAIGMLACLIACMGAGIFDHFFFNMRFPHTVAIFWLVVGLLVVATRLANPEEQDS